jgi:hypothetical protein
MWNAVFGQSCVDPLWFWTSVLWSSSEAFSVLFKYGDVNDGEIQYKGFGAVRCVRAGGQTPSDESRFVDLGQTLFDRLTGLEWEKVPLNSSGRNWAQALEDCLASNKAGGGWRLPNVKELYSIVETRGDGTGCQWNQVFQGDCYWYWSSTPAPWSSSSAFSVFFDFGDVNEFFVYSYYFGVRCVRAGQE